MKLVIPKVSFRNNDFWGFGHIRKSINLFFLFQNLLEVNNFGSLVENLSSQKDDLWLRSYEVFSLKTHVKQFKQIYLRNFFWSNFLQHILNEIPNPTSD